jgi:hypothetical protein
MKGRTGPRVRVFPGKGAITGAVRPGQACRDEVTAIKRHGRMRIQLGSRFACSGIGFGAITETVRPARAPFRPPVHSRAERWKNRPSRPATPIFPAVDLAGLEPATLELKSITLGLRPAPGADKVWRGSALPSELQAHLSCRLPDAGSFLPAVPLSPWSPCPLVTVLRLGDGARRESNPRPPELAVKPRASARARRARRWRGAPGALSTELRATIPNHSSIRSVSRYSLFPIPYSLTSRPGCPAGFEPAASESHDNPHPSARAGRTRDRRGILLCVLPD